MGDVPPPRAFQAIHPVRFNVEPRCVDHLVSTPIVPSSRKSYEHNRSQTYCRVQKELESQTSGLMFERHLSLCALAALRSAKMAFSLCTETRHFASLSEDVGGSQGHEK
jgi:hypothetical protein